MSKVPGLGERIRARLRALGYWKKGRPDILRFCQDKGYRPQYVYAWLKDRVPAYANLRRLSADLQVPMAWIMFGQDGGAVSAARAEAPRVVEAASGDLDRPRADRGRDGGPAGATGRPPASAAAPGPEPPPAQIIDFRRLRDVTDRLVQLEGELDAIFRAFPDLYFWLDAEGTILSYKAGRGSDPFLPPDTRAGQRLRDLGPPEVGRLLHEAHLEALHTGELVAVEYALAFPGGLHHREARFLTLEGTAPASPRVLAIVRDITERKRGEDTTQALVRVGRELAGTLDLAEATSRVVATVLELFRARRSALYRLDRESGAWRVIAAAGEGDAGEWVGRTVPVSAGVAGRALTEGRPAWSSDVLTDPTLTLPEPVRGRIEREGYRSAIAVPLTARGEVFGALVLGDEVGRAFSGAEVQLLSVFADQAALALENARLYTEAEQGRREAEVIAGLGRDISASLDLDTVMQRVVDGATELCGSDAAWIALRTAGSEGVVFRYGTGLRFADRLRLVEPGQGLGGQTLAGGRPVRTADYAADPRLTKDFVAGIQAEGIVSAIVVPIRIEARVEGLLYAANRTARPFTDRHEAILTRLADHAAIALENARLYAEAEHRRAAAESLAAVGRVVSQSLDSAEVAQRVADSVRSLLGALASVVYRFQPESGTRVALGMSGELGPTFRTGTVLPADTGLPGLVARTLGPVVTADLLADPRVRLTPELREFIEAAPYRAGLAVPLVIQGRVIGAVSVGDGPGRVFSDDEVRLVQAFADQAALALENARLYADAERRRREAEVIAELGRTVNASLDVDLVLQRVVEGARELCRSDVAQIALRDGDAEAMILRYGVSCSFPGWGGLRIEPGQGAGGRVLLDGRPFRTDDYATDPRISKDFLAQAAVDGTRAAVVVPIWGAERMEGLLYAENRTPRPFTDHDEAVLARLADHAAIAIRNARLYAETERRRRAAESLADLGGALSQSLDPEEVGQRVADSVRALLGARASALHELDAETGDLVIRAYSGDSGLGIGRGTVFPKGTAVVGLVVRERDTVATPDFVTDARLTLTPEMRARAEVADFRAILAAPLVAKGRVIGALSVADVTGRVFTEEEKRLVRAFADQAAFALENARLYAETERRRKTAETLARLGRLVLQAGGPEAAACEIADDVLIRLGVQASAVYRMEPDSQTLAAVAVAGPAGSRSGSAVGAALARLAIRERGPVASPDPLTDPRITLTPELRAEIEETGARSALAVPLAAGDRAVGALVVADRPGRIFDQEDVRLAQAFADQAAGALQRRWAIRST